MLVTGETLYKAYAVFYHSNAVVTGLNPTWGMNIAFFCVCLPVKELMSVNNISKLRKEEELYCNNCHAI
jgi:hypothetical protein